MIYTEVIPYIYITDLKYLKRTNIRSGTILLLSNLKFDIHENVNIIRLPLEYIGKVGEYKENVEKNKQIIANQLITLINIILEVHKNPNRENLYISCPDGLQAAPFIFLAYLVMYAKMTKEDALVSMLSKNYNFFYRGSYYIDILK